MRLLVAYRYGGLGGVETQIAARMRHLARVPGLEVRFLFAKDYGIADHLAPFGRVHIEPDPTRLGPIVEGVDVAAVIDTEEYLDAIVQLGKPVLLEIHTTVESGLGYLERPHRATAYLVPSERSRRMIRERYGIADDVHVVPDIVDGQVFHPIPAPRHPRPILLWVGRLDTHKGFERMLEMTARLCLERTVDLWIAGGDTAPADVRAYLIEVADDLGLSARFRWFPRLQPSAMPRLYAYAAASGGVFVSTSRDESFGMAVVEALLCGLPVVASDVGAIPEIGAAQYLALYPLEDPAAGVRRIADTLSGHGSIRSALLASRPALAARYAPEAIGPRYLELLEEVRA